MLGRNAAVGVLPDDLGIVTLKGRDPAADERAMRLLKLLMASMFSRPARSSKPSVCPYSPRTLPYLSHHHK